MGENPQPGVKPRHGWTAVLVAYASGVLMFLAGYLLIKGQFQAIGTGLFIVLPLVMGASCAGYLARQGYSFGTGLLISFLATLTAPFLLIPLAWEGLICILLIAPVIGVAGLLGGAIGYWVGRLWPARSRLYSVVLLLPLVTGYAESRALPEWPAEQSVSTAIVVNAPPEVVWRHIGQFPAIRDEELAWVFDLGLPYPTQSVLEGEGVGAARQCRFSKNVVLKEKVVVWEPGRQLTFEVLDQPARGPFEYFRSTRGQYVLEELPGGKTRVTGTSWYRLRVHPRTYSTLWADYIVHKVHDRVLAHIETLAETDETN